MSVLEVKCPCSLLLAELMRHQCIDFFITCRLLLHGGGLDNLPKKKKKTFCRVQGKLTAKFVALLNFLLLQSLFFSGYLCVCVCV